MQQGENKFNLDSKPVACLACSLRRDSDLTVPKDPTLHTQIRYENRMLKDLLLQLQTDIS